jgi:hypothetical protein
MGKQSKARPSPDHPRPHLQAVEDQILEPELPRCRMGHSSSAAALRYQHVMAGRDAAIAAALDELVQAAWAQTEDAAAAPGGTRVA